MGSGRTESIFWDRRNGSGACRWRVWVCVLLLGLVGCAKYNTYYNANKAFREAEQIRQDRIKQGEEVLEPTSVQKDRYNAAIVKCQKILDEYPGSGVTDDALFLMAKAYHRLNSYRASIRNFELLFTNFPATSFEEEAIYLQALNYLMIGDVGNSSELLERLRKSYPKSRYQAQALRVSGENNFVLEHWADARLSFEEYLERYPKADDRDLIAQKLAFCHWELGEYDAAAEILTPLSADASSRKQAFDAQLLLARVEAYRGRHAEADAIVTELKNSAETYQAEGEVALVEAENLEKQGDDTAAATVLENMPEEWLTTEVRPRRHDLLGRLYFRGWRLEEARAELQEAVKGATVLEDPEWTRQQLNMLRDYLAAEQSLPDAKPERVPSLKLLQANVLLFGMERPHMAASRYLEVAFDANADSATAVRGLYGAYLVYQEHLALPDSAGRMADELTRTYPNSPQAFLIREGQEANLLAYLLVLRDEARFRQAEIAVASGQESGQLGGERPTGAESSLGLPGGLVGAGATAGTRRETRNPRAYTPRPPRWPPQGAVRADSLQPPAISPPRSALDDTTSSGGRP